MCSNFDSIEMMEEILRYMMHMEIGELSYPQDLRPIYASGILKDHFPIVFTKNEQEIGRGGVTTELLKNHIERYGGKPGSLDSDARPLVVLGDIITDFTYKDRRKFKLGEGCCLIWREIPVRRDVVDQIHDEGLINYMFKSLKKIKNTPLTTFASNKKRDESIQEFEQRISLMVGNDRRHRLEVYSENSCHSSATSGKVTWIRLKSNGFRNLNPNIRYSICLHELKFYGQVCTMMTPPVGRDNYDQRDNYEQKRPNPMKLIRPTVGLIIVFTLTQVTPLQLVNDFIDMLQHTVFDVLHDDDRISVIFSCNGYYGDTSFKISCERMKNFGRNERGSFEGLASRLKDYALEANDASQYMPRSLPFGNLHEAFAAGSYEFRNGGYQMQMPINRLLVFTSDDMSQISSREDYGDFCSILSEVSKIQNLHTTLFSFHETSLDFAHTFPGVENSQNLTFVNVELFPTDVTADASGANVTRFSDFSGDAASLTKEAIKASLSTYVSVLSDTCFSPEGTIVLTSNYRFFCLDYKVHIRGLLGCLILTKLPWTQVQNKEKSFFRFYVDDNSEEPFELQTLRGQDAREENQKLLVRYEENRNDKLVFHFHFEDALAELREIARVSSQDYQEELWYRVKIIPLEKLDSIPTIDSYDDIFDRNIHANDLVAYMFHEINGRNNFSIADIDNDAQILLRTASEISLPFETKVICTDNDCFPVGKVDYEVPPLPQDYVRPQPEVMSKMLAREQYLRLCPETQRAYADVFMNNAIKLTTLIQVAVVREFGYPASYVRLLRSAMSLYSREEIPLESMPHYVRFNRSSAGVLKIGDDAPNVALSYLGRIGNGEEEKVEFSDFHTIVKNLTQSSGKPVAIISGSFT